MSGDSPFRTVFSLRFLLYSVLVQVGNLCFMADFFLCFQSRLHSSRGASSFVLSDKGSKTLFLRRGPKEVIITALVSIN